MQAEETKARKRGKTRECYRRRQESSYLRNTVRELAAEDALALRQIMRKKFDDFNVILREIEEDPKNRA